MIKILRMALALLVGGGIGLLIGGLFFVVAGSGSWAEYFDNLMEVDVLEILELVVWAIVWMMVAAVVQIVVHEGGHLVAGLLTGYRFVSFRVFSLTLIRKDGRFQWRRFSIGGTGGQCLMAPPDRPLDQIDTRWYNLGGVLANLIVSVAALLVFCLCNLPMWAGMALVMTFVVGFFYVLVNGVPMKVGGILNDGHNLLHLEKSATDKRLLCQMLQTNASIQEGTRPRDLPEEFFDNDQPTDWSDGLQANWQMMVVARLEDQHRWEEARQLLGEAIAAKKVIPRLFWMEAVCEMVFVCLADDNADEARTLYTPEIRKYVEAYARTQSSKQRVNYAVALKMDDRQEKAAQILSKLRSERQQYLLQGEVDMDLDLMEWLGKANIR